MAFKWRDNPIYDELPKLVQTAAVTKGDLIVQQDVAGFWVNDLTAAQIAAGQNEAVLIYRCRQVEADKSTGTGEAIIAGDRLYYYPALDTVSPTAVGTAGTDYYFVGWAKKDAAASATTVLMNFDGTRYDQAA